MRLSKLITAIETLPDCPPPGHDPDIVSIHYHAGDVQPGGLFVAIPGLTADGHNFIAQAVENKAAAIVAGRSVEAPVPVVVTGDTRVALARLSARLYGDPAADMVLIGLTGTNGKTTTAYIIESILTRAGLATGVIGTIEYRYAGRHFDNPMTTPESSDLQRILSEMKSAGVSHVVMEVSSHALDLKRVHGCRFTAAVFTNLTRDHLDYHKDMAHYWACKKLLFTEHLASGQSSSAAAIINSNDKMGADLIATLQSGKSTPVILTAGDTSDSKIRSLACTATGAGMSVTLATPSGRLDIRSPLVGHHNLENMMAAVGVGLHLKISRDTIRQGITSLSAVPGRLEPVANNRALYVFVDYAHTPDALENVLQALAPLRKTRIICVFGCGGDRDRTKRPLMGAIAGRRADIAVVTSDNPRTEDPDAIIAEILEGDLRANNPLLTAADLRNGIARTGYLVEPDRQRAIRLAVDLARPGDILLIAGKGHETYQIRGTEKFDFDDRAEAAAALEDAGPGNRTDRWSVPDLLAATGGTLAAGDQRLTFTDIAIDSRTIAKDAVFCAIRGENHDGHQFTAQVLEKGVKGILCADDRLAELADLRKRYSQAAWISVPDTTVALGRLGHYHRNRLGVPVVAITGSNGKTSTRNMIAAVLSQQFPVLTTAGNYNNEIGLPLTLLRLKPDHAWAVVELGMNHPGEIRYLAGLCDPQVGVITNIGPAHLEFLGSLDGVKHAKGELLEALPAKGLAILNGDDPKCRELARTCPCPVHYFGCAPDAGIRFSNITPDAVGLAFILELPESRQTVRMNVAGHFMVTNALAAASVGLHLGLSGEQIKAGLESFLPVSGRLNVKQAPSGVNIIDDTYNANPGSMAVAIDTLVQRAGKHDRFLVLGNMAELGTHAPQLHYELGRKAATATAARLYLTGENADSVAAGAAAGGMAADAIIVGDHQAIIADLKQNLKPGDWILIKGSRLMHMETITAGLAQ
ncbi:MAG: UDP-N-acetylmuramoyl-L-alanyl-D-glutamate--2,6-diaminopimelate ligase [Desulfobacterales bacterium]|nr:UDP-N-acetylmuramoyl-L-alanyl-D-glutamate--2,6-diaminopimelate ligase [Desulfobacterales bacterium]